MAIPKRRKPSQREPVGVTKSIIIVYISEKGEATITDIREHLRSKKNIRNIKVIRKHLSDLVSEKVICVKKAESRGLSDIYYIEKSFSSFKTAFNFLNDFYKPLFLKSKYAKELIFSDDFLIDGIANMGIEMFKDLIQLRDEKKLNEMIEKAKRNGEDVSSKEIKEMISLFSDFNENQPMDFKSILDTLIKSILNTVIKSIFPDKKGNEMLQIISTSPMAMDYFLNLKSVDRTYLFVMILWFYIKLVFKDQDKVSLIKKVNENPSELKNNPMTFISEILNNQNVLNDNPLFAILRSLNIQNVLNDNPHLSILKSYFIVDAINGNIVDNEYSNSVLKKILLPKVSQ